MKQHELQKHIRGQGAQLSKKTCRILPPNYKSPAGAIEVRGLATNETKNALPKNGYDFFCPDCGQHLRGVIKRTMRCPSGHRWIVDSRGRPVMGVTKC